MAKFKHAKQLRRAPLLGLAAILCSPAAPCDDDCAALVGKTFLADQGSPPLDFAEKRHDGIYLDQVIPVGQRFKVTALNPGHHGPDELVVLTRDGRQLSINCSQLQSAVDPTWPAQQVLASSWGEPSRRNHTITAAGDVEQWVYAERYQLYFTNGPLTGIQTDSPDTGFFRVAR